MKEDLFEKMPVPKAYLTLAMPVVLSMMVSLVYNMVDTYFIALTNNTNLVAGVSLMSPLFCLMVAFGDIWGLGGSSLISRLLGNKQYEDAKHACSFAFWAAIIFSLCVTGILLLFRVPILNLLGANEATMEYASGYYFWIAIGAAAIILGLVPSNILRTEGLAAPAMIGSMIGSVANIILDPIFIFTLNKGAAGAAIATVLGNLLADAYFVYVFLTKSKRLSIAVSDARLPIATVGEILRIGVPASTTNIMQSFMMAITNNFLLSYGTDKVAALGIALKVNMITLLILVGFAFGGQPLIGYNYGAKNKERLKETMRFAYAAGCGCALVFTAIMMLFAPYIIRIFMNDAEIVKNGALMLRCLESSMVFMTVVLVSSCICQSFGRATGALILALSRQGIVYVVVIMIASRLFGYHGILLSQAVSDVITAGIAVLITRSNLKLIG